MEIFQTRHYTLTYGAFDCSPFSFDGPHAAQRPSSAAVSLVSAIAMARHDPDLTPLIGVVAQPQTNRGFKNS